MSSDQDTLRIICEELRFKCQELDSLSKLLKARSIQTFSDDLIHLSKTTHDMAILMCQYISQIEALAESNSQEAKDVYSNAVFAQGLQVFNWPAFVTSSNKSTAKRTVRPVITDIEINSYLLMPFTAA